MPGLGRAAPARRPLNRDQRAVTPLINNIIGKMEAFLICSDAANPLSKSHHEQAPLLDG